MHDRYSPYASSAGSYYSPDGALCDVDAYGTVQLRPLHRLPGRDLAFLAPRLQGKNVYTFAGGAASRPRPSVASYFPANDHNVVHMPPVADAKHAYASWDLEDLEKYRLQSIRRESRARQKAKGPVVSQYDNMSPARTAPSPTGLWMPKNQPPEKPGSQHPTLSHFPGRDSIF